MDFRSSMKFFCLVVLVGFCFTADGEVQNSTQLLWAAVGRNDPTAARDTLESWANPDWRNATGFSALHLAAADGHVEALGVLLRSGADKEAATDTGDRPLHLAAANGRDAAVALLVVAGAEIKSAGHQGRTPLLQAIHNGQTSTAALIRALLYNCVNETTAQTTKPSTTAFKLHRGGTRDRPSTQSATTSQSQDAVITEIPPIPTNTSQVEKREKEIKEATDALWTAVERNDTAAVRAAIARGADLLSRRDYGKNALHEAAALGHIGVMEALLQAGLGIESEDRDGDRPLHWAARRGTAEAVSWLVNAGADLRSRGQDDRTPVEVADLADNIDTKALLINLGALL